MLKPLKRFNYYQADGTQTGEPVPDNDGTQTGEPGEESQEILINEQIISDFGLPKSLMGKPLSEAAKIHRDVRTELTHSQQQLSQLTKAQQKEVKEEVKEELGEMPDPYDYPKEFQKWLDKRDKIFQGKIEEKFASSLEPYEKEKLQMREQKAHDELTKVIEPDELESVVTEWASDLTQEQAIYYEKNPDKAVKLILNFYKARELDKLLDQKEDGDEKVRSAKKKIVDEQHSNNKSTKAPSSNLISEMYKQVT